MFIKVVRLACAVEICTGSYTMAPFLSYTFNRHIQIVYIYKHIHSGIKTFFETQHEQIFLLSNDRNSGSLPLLKRLWQVYYRLKLWEAVLALELSNVSFWCCVVWQWQQTNGE